MADRPSSPRGPARGPRRGSWRGPKGAPNPSGPGREGGTAGSPGDRRDGGLVERRKKSERRRSLGRDRRSADAGLARPVHVETVFFYLYDVGRSIDLEAVGRLVPAHPDLGVAKRRDSPASLTLPLPLILELGPPEGGLAEPFERVSSQAKIYEEGVVTVVVRARARQPLGELHLLEGRPLDGHEGGLAIERYAEAGFARLVRVLSRAIVDPRAPEEMGRESYSAYCLLECDGDPAAFVERESDYIAALLVGETPGAGLHHSQVGATLASPFSYRDDDLAIFELDRCLVIDPRADYEDLLLIAEHANYQLLELRVLDKLLDSWLDRAEDDLRDMTRSVGRLSRATRSAGAQVAHIQRLRFDALFILENLENSSKIIGDYYLGQVYERLCRIFNTEGWKWSVERRLDTLQNVYDMVKADSAERRMMALEVTFIIVCIIFPIIQILQVMLAPR